MVVPLTSEVTERAPELMPGEATGQVCARVGSRASFGVRGVDTERILEVDAVFTSSVMCTKQTVKPPAVRLSLRSRNSPRRPEARGRCCPA